MTAKANRRKQGIQKLSVIVFIMICAILLFAAQKYHKEEIYGDGLTVHFIDVGQGDSILLMSDDGNVLIDAGPNSAEEALSAYLKSVNVKKIDYLILTHPHEDHIGGADMILYNFDVGTVIMSDADSATATYERLIAALETSDAVLYEARSGDTYRFGDLSLRLLAPNSDKYKNLNNFSVVVKASFGDVDFMLTGDAEVLSEKEILERYSERELRCDILKAGHHGSNTSTSDKFLGAVHPEICIISCGANNTFGHPGAATLSKLNRLGTPYLRTDIDGTIVIKTDGKTWNRVR